MVHGKQTKFERSKTEFQLIGAKQKLKTHPDQKPLIVQSSKFSNRTLGVTVDENLSWKAILMARFNCITQSKIVV